MELRVTAVLLLLTGVILFTSIEGHIPRCCIQVLKDVSCQKLRAVRNYDVQDITGACEIEALILHIKGKKICADPKFTPLLKDKKKNRKWFKNCKRLKSQISA